MPCNKHHSFICLLHGSSEALTGYTAHTANHCIIHSEWCMHTFIVQFIVQDTCYLAFQLVWYTFLMQKKFSKHFLSPFQKEW